jgi:formylglycine-generating enzyme required for sulfatase activity
MLQPSDLTELAYWLRENGFAVSTDQLIAAGKLANGTRQFSDHARLAAYLAPVFCINEEQQNDFTRVYAAWQRQHDPNARQSAAEANLPTQVEEAIQPPTASPAQVARSNSLATQVVLWVFLLAALVIIGTSIRQLPNHVEPITQKSQASSAPLPDSSPTKSVGQASQNLPAPEIGLLEEIYNPNWLAISLLVFLLAAFGAWWLYGKRMQLQVVFQRLLAGAEQEVKSLRDEQGRARDVLVSDARKLAKMWQRHVMPTSSKLDVVATINATVRAGGRVELVYCKVGEPGYLVLVDCAGRNDHQARLVQEMLATMLAQHVPLTRYEFDGDLRRSCHVPSNGNVLYHGPQSLTHLARRHAGARLLIFSDGRGFIDPYTGRVPGWLSAVREWDMPVMITPQERQKWGVREWLLSKSGLMLLPMSGEGMQILAQLFDSDSRLPKQADSTRRQPRPLFLRDVEVWLDQIAPPPEEIRKLLQALQDDLGRHGMDWLCGCAIYPEIHWGLTLAIGDSLLDKNRAEYTKCLTQLVRLPWFRVGFMPNWLRQTLLARLSAENATKARTAVAEFLAPVVEGKTAMSSDALQIAIPSQVDAVDLALAAEEKVFLRFMSGRMKRHTMDVGDSLHRLFYRYAPPLARGRMRALAMLIALCTGVVVMTSPVDVKRKPALASVGNDLPPKTPSRPSFSKWAVGDAFQDNLNDGSKGPIMVVIPAGSFKIGSDKFEHERNGPEINIAKNFAVGKFEVTVSEYFACVQAGKCRAPGWHGVGEKILKKKKDMKMTVSEKYYSILGTALTSEEHPIVGVSWDDAKDFVAWLNESSPLWRGIYRLPSEAEWEYAARAGTTTEYSWGGQASHEKANYGSDACCAGLVAGADKWLYTSPVGSFEPNGYGLHDMHGNVWEWVEDCYFASYVGMATYGGAVAGCEPQAQRVMRGGAWDSSPLYLRTAYRNFEFAGRRLNNTGFRVVKDLGELGVFLIPDGGGQPSPATGAAK